MIASLGERFWDKVDIASQCWNWTAYCNSDGYGHIGIDGKVKAAHRVMFEFAFGPIPEGKEVCHSCDNPKCVNPRHLFLGTHAENIKDAAKKKRMRHGELHRDARLTGQDVVKIRESKCSLRKLSKQFGVSHVAILRVKTRKNWKHVA